MENGCEVLTGTGIACFFTFMTIAEGGGKRAVARKFQDVYVPTLKANYLIWPAVQMLNFRVIPLQFQIVRNHRFSLTVVCNLTNRCVAFCFHHWYCVDRISLHDELVR